MRIQIAGFAMCGPAGMTDTGCGVKVFPNDGFFQVRHFPFFLIDLYTTVL